MTHLRTVLVALALAVPGAAPAQQTTGTVEVTPAGIPAAVPAVLDAGAPPGAQLTMRTDRPFARYSLPTGPYAAGAPKARTLEGRVIRSAWRLAEPDATTAAVMAGYRERLNRLGYEPLFSCASEDCGGIDFRFAVELLPPPAMLVDAADFAQLSAKRAGPAGDTYVSILVSRLLGAVYMQTVAVAPGVEPQVAPEPAAVAETVEDAPPGLPGAAARLIEPLLAYGHVRLESLDFEIGSAALTPDSTPAMDRAAEVLATRPDLKLLVVGHSDNQGSLADNIALSRRRAEAVRQALVDRGIEASRLQAEGAGFLAPIASNATPEGRALNRRVELVLR